MRLLPRQHRRVLLLGGLCAAALGMGSAPGRAAAQDRAPSAAWPAPVIDSLVRFGREDQDARADIGRAFAGHDTATLNRMVATDSARSRWLRRAASAYGWPTRSAVGPRAADAAWLILQHSPFTGWQAEMLPALERLAERGELPRPDLALLADRVLVERGQPQRYGTQFGMAGGRLVPSPIADPAGLEARRTAMGLPPMAEYARMLAQMYKLPVAWPPAR